MNFAKFLFVATLGLVSSGVVCAAAGDPFFQDEETIYLPTQRVKELMYQGKEQQALELAEKSLENNPKSAQLRFIRGVLLNDLGRKQEAKEVFEQMIREFPEISEPYNNLAVMYAAEGNLGMAKDLLEKALANNAKSALTYSNLGNVYLAMARDSFRQAAKTNPNNKMIQSKIQGIDKLLNGVEINTSQKPQKTK